MQDDLKRVLKAIDILPFIKFSGFSINKILYVLISI
jgi:hypothetical protein